MSLKGKVFGVTEGLFTLSISIVIIVSLYSPLIEGGQVAVQFGSSAIRRGAYGVAVAFSLIGVFRSSIKAAFAALSPALLAFSAWAAISLTWSSNVSLSAVKLSMFLSLVLCILPAIRFLGIRYSLKLCFNILSAVMVINLFTVLAFPKIGLNYHPDPWISYQWRGLMGDKNASGASASLYLILILLMPNLGRVLRFSLAVAVIAYLVFTNSLTAQVSVLITLVAVTIARSLPRSEPATNPAHENMILRRIIVWGPVIAVVGGALAIELFTDALAPLFQDRSVMSNRGEIWWPLIQAFSEHPIIGTGYGAYWDQVALTGNAGTRPWLSSVTKAHNGYLDLLLDVGVIGIFLALLTVYVEPVERFISISSENRYRLLPALGILFFVLTSNIAESGLLMYDNIWSCFLIIALGMLRSEIRRKRKKISGDTDGSIDRSNRRNLRRQSQSSSLSTSTGSSM